MCCLPRYSVRVNADKYILRLTSQALTKRQRERSSIMLPDPLTLTLDVAETTDVVYNVIEQSGRKTVRQAEGTSLGLPWLLTISHQAQGKNMDAIDRHLFRLDRVLEDSESDDGIITGSVYTVVVAPRRVFTTAKFKEMLLETQSFWKQDSWGLLTDFLENQS
jgi:hypothetical protein